MPKDPLPKHWYRKLSQDEEAGRNMRDYQRHGHINNVRQNQRLQDEFWKMDGSMPRSVDRNRLQQRAPDPVPKSGRGSLYSQFVKENYSKAPGNSPREKIANIAKMWQARKAGKKPRAPRKKGRGDPASDIPGGDTAEEAKAGSGQAGGCADCQAGSGRRRRRGAKRGGEIAAAAPPIQGWSGGSLGPLSPANQGSPVSQSGFGMYGGALRTLGGAGLPDPFSSVLSAVGSLGDLFG